MNDNASPIITPTAPRKNHTGMSIWDVSIEITNRVYTWAYVALVLGAAVTAIATMSLFWSSAVRDKYADQQIQMARTEAIEATASAERARAEQKRLQVELEHERVERLRFEREFAWRTLSSTQENSLVQDLSVAPSAINVEFVSNDPEVTFLAIQFQRIFKAAGWKVEAVANTYAGSVFFGIFVPDPRDKTSVGATQTVREALRRAGISFVTDKPPMPIMGFGGNVNSSSAVQMVIASKATENILRAINGALASPTPHSEQPTVPPKSN